MIRPRLLLAVLLSTLAVACGPKVSTERFAVVAAPNANQTSPVAVDLVLVRTEALVPVVSELSAREWFDARDQLVRDHPEGLLFHSWEFVPGRTVEIDRLPFPSRDGVALLVFADYLSDGVHRLRVDPMRTFRLVLRNRGFEVEPDPGT